MTRPALKSLKTAHQCVSLARRASEGRHRFLPRLRVGLLVGCLYTCELIIHQLCNKRLLHNLTLLALLFAFSHHPSTTFADDLHTVIRDAQRKVVKIYGAGGFRQLEAYQTGLLISPEGHVLTAQSYVLDTEDLAVVSHDGRKWQAEYLASDPITDLAMLKITLEGATLPYFDYRADASQLAAPGERILALSNLYGIATGDEPVSVLQGVITAVAPLRARRGAYQSNYRDDAYVLDAYANNPGAAGGALIDWQGNLLGVLGKELRSEVTGTWLNYALPLRNIQPSVEAMIEGRIDTDVTASLPAEESHSAEALGVALVPDVLPRTPPYIDAVRRDSPAERAGLRPDDLVVFVNGEPVDSHKAWLQRLQSLEKFDPVVLSVLRKGELRDFELKLTDDSESDEDPGLEREKP